MDSLEEALGHHFAKPEILAEALIHRSYHAEHPGVAHNERFEFLGDAVLGLAVTTFLFDEFGHMPEGQMAKVRAAVVNREELADVARRLGLPAYVKLGRGEESTGGRYKASILADAMEALIAAVYLDSGYGVAAQVVMAHWADRTRIRAQRPGGADYKTRLQEVLAASGLSPRYEVAGFGPDHAKQFTASVMIDGQIRGEGRGGSKREAEQEAARAALDSMTAE
ncbi:MAG: ribonuclease III [Acidimicrobiia bacterium]